MFFNKQFVILLTLFESWNIFFDKYDSNFVDVSKICCFRSSENKVFLKKAYDVITHVRDAINKVLSRDSNYVVRVDT